MKYTAEENAEIGKRIREYRGHLPKIGKVEHNQKKYNTSFTISKSEILQSEDFGISQLDLANSFGIDKSDVSKLENGKKTISEDILYKFIYNENGPANMKWLLDGVGKVMREPGDKSLELEINKAKVLIEFANIQMVRCHITLFYLYLIDNDNKTKETFVIDEKKIYVAITTRDENDADKFYADPNNMKIFKEKWKARNQPEGMEKDPPADMLEYYVADELSETYKSNLELLKHQMNSIYEIGKDADSPCRIVCDEVIKECTNLRELISKNMRYVAVYKKRLAYEYNKTVKMFNTSSVAGKRLAGNLYNKYVEETQTQESRGEHEQKTDS